METISIAIERKKLQVLFSQITRSSHIDLSISDHADEKGLDVFLKRVQYDAVTDEPLHVDFYHPDTEQPLRLHVPVKVIGESVGVKAGGVLNVLFDTVRVYGLAKDIPSLITLDVSELDLGEAIRVKDVDLGEVEPLLSPEIALVTIVAPRGIEVEEIEAEEEILEEEAEGEETAAAEGESEESAA
jgi:large subunit ribosomal protein L25